MKYYRKGRNSPDFNLTLPLQRLPHSLLAFFKHAWLSMDTQRNRGLFFAMALWWVVAVITEGLPTSTLKVKFQRQKHLPYPSVTQPQRHLKLPLPSNPCCVCSNLLEKVTTDGVPGWLSRLSIRLLISARSWSQGCGIQTHVEPRSGSPAQCRVSLSLSLCFSAPLTPLITCTFSQTNKYNLKKKKVALNSTLGKEGWAKLWLLSFFPHSFF